MQKASIVVTFVIVTSVFLWKQDLFDKPPIKVGILHSLTGTMAISEAAVADATLLAIEEINQQGGLLGRKLKPILVDGQSNPGIFAKEAERLITEEKVSVIFGCWTSACRKTVKPVFEKYNHLLFYPVQYEGLEQSPNIIYTGAIPNQQIVPAAIWSMKQLGKRVFLVGSDYIFPRVANSIIKDLSKELDFQIVGEEYLKLGSQKATSIIEKITAIQPDVIFNTINGDSNLGFFELMAKAEINTAKSRLFHSASEKIRYRI